MIFDMPTPAGSLNPKSVYDLCFLHMKPTIRKEVIKNQGLKMTRTILSMTTDKKPFTLEDLTIKQRSLLLDEIGELPEWFDKEEYIRKYWASFEKFLSENEGLKYEIDKITRRKISTSTSAEIYKPILDELYDITVNISSTWYTANMAEYLESDLPFELYDMYNISFLNRIRTLDVVRNSINTLSTKLHFHRSDEKKIQSDLNYFTSQFEHLLTTRMAASDSEDLLRFYIKLQNAKNIDELFVVIPLTTKKLDMEKYRQYFQQYKENLTAVTDILIEYLHHKTMPPVVYPESETIHEFQRDLSQFVSKYD